MKAYLKNYRQSPRKVRLVADLVRGKDVSNVLAELSFLPKRASKAISGLIHSATKNAENNFKVDPESLFVETISVDQGVTLKRVRARAFGRAGRINKRSSNISVTLGQRQPEEVAPAKKVKKEKQVKEEK